MSEHNSEDDTSKLKNEDRASWTGEMEQSPSPSFEENASATEEEVSGETELEVKPGEKESEGSILIREGESPMDLKRIKWEEVELLFLKTDTDTPFAYTPTFRLQPSYDAAIVNLDFSFVKGHIDKREYDYFSEKYGLFVNAYKNKIDFVKTLMDDNALFTATLRDHKKIEEWFESMPETIEMKGGSTTGSKDKSELQDIRRERLNAIAYRLVLNQISKKGDRWTKEIERMASDKKFLLDEIVKYSPDKGAVTGPRQAIANTILDIYALEDGLAEISGKIKLLDDFTHGFVARNEFLEKKLTTLEVRQTSETKELTDLKFETDNLVKTRNELRAKASENEKCLCELEENRQKLMKELQKLQNESSKGSKKSKLLGKQVEATNMERQLWEVRLMRLKERIEKCNARKSELNGDIEMAKKECKTYEKEILKERGALEKLGNKAKLLKKAIAVIRGENEAEKTKINSLKEAAKTKEDPAAIANERKKIERDIENLRREIVISSRLQGFERQEYVKVYNEIKHLQQTQWSLRKMYQDNVGKIRKAKLEVTHQYDNIHKLSLEIEKEKSNIKWIKQQKTANEKLLSKKESELDKVLSKYKTERLEKNKDLQEKTTRLLAISEWKEINRIGDTEKEELEFLNMQIFTKREELRKRGQEIGDAIQENRETLKETKAEIERAKIEYEAREKAIQKIKFELYKKQLESERVIHKFTEAATERNYKSMKLNDIIREQVCYTEHISTTEEMIRRADLELVTRMDVITRLNSIKKMECLGMDKMREKLESWQGVLDYLEDLSKRFDDVTRKQIELQMKFDGSRHRMVRDKQKDDPDEIRRKLIQLEDRVTVKEEKLIELKLLGYRANKLLEDMQRVKEEKSELVQASNNAFVDGMRKNIDAEKKTKQLAVELSLKKVMLESVKKELEEAKKNYATAMEKLEKGEAPTPEIEAEWLRSIKRFGNGPRTVQESTLKTDTLSQAITLVKY